MTPFVDLDATEPGKAGGADPREKFAGLTATAVTARWLRDNVQAEPDWLIPGLLARGWALMVSAREKTGKGTLVAYLIGKMERAEDSVFGLAAEEKVTTLVYTEEPQDSIREKVADSNVEAASYVFSWDVPKEVKALQHPAKWQGLVEVLINTAKERGHGILFIDNVSRASGVEEEGGTEMARRVELAAERCKEEGITLIVDHHHRKSGGDVRDLARGGTGTVGAVDVSLSMGRGDDENDRRRALSCVGRRKACVWASMVKLNEEGTEYELLDKEEGTSDRGKKGSAATELRRLELLAALCLAAHEETGSEWVTADEIATLWGLTLSSVKDYLKDRIPNGKVLKGPNRGRAATYSTPGWQEADTIMADNPDSPTF